MDDIQSWHVIQSGIVDHRCFADRGSSVADVILGLDADMGGWISGLVTKYMSGCSAEKRTPRRARNG